MYHNNNKLNHEAEESEEVKLQKSDIDLKCQISSLHSQVGTDVFVDCPSKFIVKLPSYDRQEGGPYRNNARDRNQEGFRVGPSIETDLVACDEVVDRILNLIHLYGSVDEESKVEETKADYLNSVLEPESIIHK